METAQPLPISIMKCVVRTKSFVLNNYSGGIPNILTIFKEVCGVTHASPLEPFQRSTSPGIWGNGAADLRWIPYRCVRIAKGGGINDVMGPPHSTGFWVGTCVKSFESSVSRHGDRASFGFPLNFIQLFLGLKSSLVICISREQIFWWQEVIKKCEGNPNVFCWAYLNEHQALWTWRIWLSI